MEETKNQTSLPVWVLFLFLFAVQPERDRAPPSFLIYRGLAIVYDLARQYEM